MFVFNRNLSGENFENYTEFPTTPNETYVYGEALKLVNGLLTKCGATDKPEYIAGTNYTAPATGNKALAVSPVMPSYEYETTFAADATAINAGSKVTLHTDGGQITATTTSGVAYIVKKLGTGAVGTKALVRFI